MDVQNNFNSKNGGNFADKHVSNTPPKQKTDAMLTSSMNQKATGIKPTGNFSSKVITN